MAQGARASVLRAMGEMAGGGTKEMADCLLCKSRLTFTVETGPGSLGRTLERCTNPRCPNRFAHTPVPDLSGKQPGERKRKSRGPRPKESA